MLGQVRWKVRGMTMVEYALLGVGIAIFVFGMVMALGGKLNEVFQTIINKLSQLR
ncbi:Flp/Fap pilin component [Thermanaeromonas toyohensis ToBE]|uniref:Flp/Fap pilin component n=1 Tax=Thermanaeromonas toyohensis ToBE TaxID=698762 RepID=A0A1W1VT14_9FIRM|nr:Flp family type IVb pilin [Thermanaeromonas toyohensis]SMB96507.1 Flp/Fap pilin component [Thermanaeromonas toyohensis ToBE]